MRSFIDSRTLGAAMPAALVRELGRVERGRGREELYREQAPQVLERLTAQSRFESITASSAIENIVVQPTRARALVDNPAAAFRDRSERELAGYKDAVDHLLAKQPERLTPELVQQLHRLLLRHTDDPHAGRLKHANNFVGNRRDDGLVEVVFRTVPAGQETERQLAELVERYEMAASAELVHPLVLIAALILDFLSIHPFVDGNGRVARLLTTQELLRHGYGVARYVSLEQRIYDAQHSYYETLQQSQRGWHEAAHDVWPFTGFLLRVVADAYDDLEARVGAQRTPAGATKETQAREYILRHGPATFRWADLVAALPDISQASLRNVLAALKAEGAVSSGLGRSAVWVRSS
jgi:Fic family protein